MDCKASWFIVEGQEKFPTGPNLLQRGPLLFAQQSILEGGGNLIAVLINMAD